MGPWAPEEAVISPQLGKCTGDKENVTWALRTLELCYTWEEGGVDAAPTTPPPLGMSPRPAPPRWLPLQGVQASDSNSFHGLSSCRDHRPRCCPGSHITPETLPSPAPLTPESSPERCLHHSSEETWGSRKTHQSKKNTTFLKSLSTDAKLSCPRCPGPSLEPDQPAQA